MTSGYDTVYDIYDNLVTFTTHYDKLQHITTHLRHLRHFCYFRHFFYDLSLLLAFVLQLVLLLRSLLPIMVNDVEDGLTQVHGVLQSNADSLEGILVLVDPVPKQSTQAVVEFKPAVELAASVESGRAI
jgi:hypothetical protein